MERDDAMRLRSGGASEGACAHATPGPTTQQRLPGLMVTTEELPAPRQFAFWRASMAAHLDPSRPGSSAEAPFQASATSWRFGPLMLSQLRRQPYAYRRNLSQIRRDSLDHWVIFVLRGGVQRKHSNGMTVEFKVGIPYVLSLADAFEAEQGSTTVELLALYIARDSVLECERQLTTLRNRPVGGPLGALLADHLIALAGCMPQLQAEDGARLAKSTLALVAAAVSHNAEPGIADGPQLAELQLARIKRIIRHKLGTATLGPARLCADAGISRSQLYRLLEPFGGVARYIQQERLRVAFRRLADPAERGNVAQIAEEVGFFEPSTFSRAFRKEFSCTPSHVRMAALDGSSLDGRRTMGQDTEGAFSALLRGL
jgi:AraC-like DNA-binding protein